MEDFKANFFKTTRHIAYKFLMLRKVNNMTQEEFAEKINVDRNTISRAEKGEYRPSGETLEKAYLAFKISISYFYDNSIYEINSEKSEIINEINLKLNTSTKEKLNIINRFIDII